MMMMAKTFKGANVFMSRNLVPPEMFDSLHDALKNNGAEIFLCCNPSRNAPNDYHIISSPLHEKFDDLREKGCNLLGPQCVLSCAKECRVLPKQGFTCCLAMDGVKVLATGFNTDDKAEIEKLVMAMGGVFHSKGSSDASFVIVKNVKAPKYKWALHAKKPIVTLSWLHQCWKEHRVVPHEAYRVLPFSGLRICTTRIPPDGHVTQILANDKKLTTCHIVSMMYSLSGKGCSLSFWASITLLVRLCPVCTRTNGLELNQEGVEELAQVILDSSPEGDKYKVAIIWGHIPIVTRKWLDQSVARRAYLDEDSYCVQRTSVSSTVRTSSMSQHSQGKVVGNTQTKPSAATNVNFQAASSDDTVDPDLEATLSQNMPFTFLDAPCSAREETGAPIMQPKTDANIDGGVADDSQTEDNDLYLSDCRILFVGFDASEMRKLVSMVRRGGGSRYMSLNEKLTHIVIGVPSETEKKEVRSLSAMGVIRVVRTVWLEDCDREKKEVPVLQRHMAYDLLLPDDHTSSNKGAAVAMPGLKQSKSSDVQPFLPDEMLQRNISSVSGMSSEKCKEFKLTVKEKSSEATLGDANQSQVSTLHGLAKGRKRVQHGSSNETWDRKSPSVFRGKIFRFSSSFPEDRRPEIVQWINQGGGEVVNDGTRKIVHFTVECHGVVPSMAFVSGCSNVSTHWIRACLEDGNLLDVGSHILFSPLQCSVPLPGFKRLRLCVSQYDEKDRLLLRNLCYTLGAKFVDKLTKKVTHLLCKFASGPKYEAASSWGIQTVTSEWISECVKQNEVVAAGPFSPKVATIQDLEAGLCVMSQYPTQAVRMISVADASQLTTQSQDLKNTQSEVTNCRSDSITGETKMSSICNKRARVLENDNLSGLLYCGEYGKNPVCSMNSVGDMTSENAGEVSNNVPDVAAAIEDLLEQTSKIHDQKSLERTGADKNIFSSDCSILGHDVNPRTPFGLSKEWINRTNKKDDISTPAVPIQTSIYDGFSETQTESQVVGYEEDLSGRQMIIDRVRTRSSLT